MAIDTLKTWHEIVESKNNDALDELLADDVVFHSPVVHTPQEGKAITKLYLSAATNTFSGGSFEYVREVTSGNNAVLEFVSEIDGITINGIDMIRWNDEGQIVDFKVMIRPLKAVNLLHRMMGEMLQKLNA